MAPFNRDSFMDEACSAHGRCDKYTQNLTWNVERQKSLQDVGINVREELLKGVYGCEMDTSGSE